MKASPIAARRCAIYTRVSTENGLDQTFNSLHAQREAAEAFVKSQAHEGWSLIRERHDDGGFSGGGLDRPALQKLLEHIRERRIDVVVVYKVDRLTRSLADFAKLVELFDAHEVSFVSVTQAFNTTTSMGRLTLNVLLSFAQFEREVTGERIRDKIAASKRKGLWMGGGVPLGYRVENRALHIVEEDAALVVSLFRRYLDLGSAVRLLKVLREEGSEVPTRPTSAGTTRGGGSFTRGHLYTILSNPIYVGATRHRDQLYEGRHPPIVELALWEAVQTRLKAQQRARTARRDHSDALLMGKLVDAKGRPFTPSYATKGTRRYRYYRLRTIVAGDSVEADAIRSVPAGEIEHLITKVVTDSQRGDTVSLPSTRRGDASISAATIGEMNIHIKHTIETVVLNKHHIDIHLVATDVGEPSRVLTIPWTKAAQRKHKAIIIPEGSSEAKQLDPKSRTKLLRAIAAARAWLAEIAEHDDIDTAAIAVRESISERQVRKQLTLAFLAPDLIQAAIDNRLPRGLGLTRLLDLPASWAAQRKTIGIAVATV